MYSIQNNADLHEAEIRALTQKSTSLEIENPTRKILKGMGAEIHAGVYVS